MKPQYLLALLLLGIPVSVSAEEASFHITFDARVSSTPFSGRVLVLCNRGPVEQPPRSPNWFDPAPMLAVDVKNWKPGEVTVVDKRALAYPVSLDRVPKGQYWIQAVMDFDRGDISFAGEGNGYSKATRIQFDPASGGPVKLHIDQVVRPNRFRESERIKLVEMESRLLSSFHGRPTRLRAAVILPASFDKEMDRRYPIIYEIPGFSGNHLSAAVVAIRNPTRVAGVEMLYVILDPSCRWGHHVFADSDNNGPCGQALVEELIPQIESRFRALGKPEARFVTGHSSGGWSSLWLQVTYPDYFGGVWSTAPDPVDFRDFQRINLYAPGENMFMDRQGKPRPIARQGRRPLLYFKPFSDMEEVMGHGGQLGSFEAVFSPRGPDGRPRKLWNRTTGEIDPEVAKAWQRYDIRKILEANWPTLRPKLTGKIHIYMGSQDTFYLEGATILLKESLEKLGSDAVIEIFPGADHGSLMTRELRQRIAREMAETFKRNSTPGSLQMDP